VPQEVELVRQFVAIDLGRAPQFPLEEVEEEVAVLLAILLLLSVGAKVVV